MWKDSEYDHATIQTTVVGVDDAVLDPPDPRLLAFSTSYVFENYVRPSERALFGSELRVVDGECYEIQEVTQILAGPSSEARAIFLRSETFFLGLDFKPLIEGVSMNEVSRGTVRDFVMRNNKVISAISVEKI